MMKAKVSKQLLDLARGPFEEAVCYNGYIVNGFRFRKMKSIVTEELKVVESW